MKAELYFGLKMTYLRTAYEPLTRIVVAKPVYNYGSHDYLWIFKYKDIEKVEAIIGTIEIPGLRENFKKEEVPIPKFKGKDFIEIVEYPKIYQIVEHRKVEDPETEEIMVKTLKHNVDKAIVDKIRKEVIVHMPMYKKLKVRTYAEKVCNVLGITRFNRPDSNSFNFPMLFGNRSSYFRIVYYPLKVFQWKGEIIHHKDGAVERIK